MFYSTTSPYLMQSFSPRFRFICPNWFICARIMFVFSIRRVGACSRRRSIRTAEDVCLYNKRTSVCFLPHQKSVAGSGTQPQVSRRLFCFFFLRLKKEDIPHIKKIPRGIPRRTFFLYTVIKLRYFFCYFEEILMIFAASIISPSPAASNCCSVSLVYRISPVLLRFLSQTT